MISLPVHFKGPVTQLCARVLTFVVGGMSILCLGTDSRLSPRPFDRNDIAGEWSDACPCRIPCPCWKTSRSQVRRCVNVQVFHIEHGQYQGIDFAGATLVLVNTPETDFDSPGSRILYVAQEYDKADGARALSRLFSDIFKLPPRRGIRFVRMNTIITYGRQVVAIPNVLTYVVSQSDGLSRPDDTVRDDLYSWLEEPKQWRTQKVSYLPEKTQYQRTNALYGRFRVSVEKEENK